MFILLLLTPSWGSPLPPGPVFPGMFPNCGFIAPALFAGSGVPTVTPEELKKWKAYVAELDDFDQQFMNEVWAQADFKGRKKLLGLLDTLKAEEAKKREEEKKKEEESKKLNLEKKN